RDPSTRLPLRAADSSRGVSMSLTGSRDHSGSSACYHRAVVTDAPIRAPGQDPSPKAGPALVVDRLTKRFGERAAFEGVSFTVAAGEVFGFLGPNGAGKTTMVRTLGTLIAPTSGSAVVAGIPLTSDNGTEIRQRISIMPENPGLYLRLTVVEN